MQKARVKNLLQKNQCHRNLPLKNLQMSLKLKNQRRRNLQMSLLKMNLRKKEEAKNHLLRQPQWKHLLQMPKQTSLLQARMALKANPPKARTTLTMGQTRLVKQT
jgi:hypothetical protein